MATIVIDIVRRIIEIGLEIFYDNDFHEMHDNIFVSIFFMKYFPYGSHFSIRCIRIYENNIQCVSNKILHIDVSI